MRSPAATWTPQSTRKEGQNLEKRHYTTPVMRPLRGLTWGGTAYVGSVIVLGAALVPISVLHFPVSSRSTLISLLYLGLLTQLAALMSIKWPRGKQTLDTMPLVAASLLAPGVGPVILSWVCRNDGRWPSPQVPLARLLFNRARLAIVLGLPSMALVYLPLPASLEIPVKTLCLVLGDFVLGYPLTALTIAAYERETFWRVFSSNVGMSSIRSVLILGIGGGALFIVLQHPAGYVMGFGLLGLLLAVRTNMADAQRQQIERIQTLELMAQALDARDPLTELHSQRVSNLAAQIAQALGMSALEVERIRVAGLLHDIGKIGVPDSVLKKPSALEPGEWVLMRRHAEVGAEMIARHSALEPIAPWVRHHHERWNGSGYPGGLTTTQIPLGARILAVADSYDTITGPRVYRRSSLSPIEAVADISAGSDILYDPIVVNALRQIHHLPPMTTSELEPALNGGSMGVVELLKTNSKLRALATAMAISSLGDPLTAIAVTVTAFALTHNGIGVAAALILRGAAMMIAGTLLGGAADRLQRRRLVVVADLVQFSVLVVLPVVIAIVPWALFAAVMILGAATALSSAGREASVAVVAETGQIAAANGAIGTATLITRSVGYPLAAGLIWLAASTTPLYLIDAFTFFAAALLTLRAGPLGGGIVSRSLTGAFRAAVALKEVRPSLAIAALGAFLIFATQPAVIVLAHTLSSSGTLAYTILEVVLTAGMLAGALVFAWAAPRPRIAMLTGFVLMGALSIGAAVSPVLLLTAGALFIASIGNQWYFLGNRTELQKVAQPDRLGSVMATRGVLAQTMSMVGGAAGGFLSAALGGRAVFAIAGAGFLVLAVGVGTYASRRAAAHEAIVRRDVETSSSSLSASVEIAETA